MSLNELLAARLQGDAILPLLTLESGAVIGLDAKGRWTFQSDERPLVTFDAVAIAFGEALEQPRDTFEDALTAAARAAELPDAEVVAAFPALALVRAVLAKEFAYTTRLALLWIRPSELREMRTEIVAVTTSSRTPVPLRDLAKRLVVPLDPK